MDVCNARVWGRMCKLVFVGGGGVLFSISGINSIAGIAVGALVDGMQFFIKLEC